MLHVITGGSASGKSAYAEAQAAAAPGGERYYVATMRPNGEEGQRCVERHRAMRAGKGFFTLECYSHLAGLILPGEASGDAEARVRRTILLECISNLTANEQFTEGGGDHEILGRILGGVRRLRELSANVIVVTNEVFSDGIAYDDDTRRYLGILGRVNQELSLRADRVTEVVYGIPIALKGHNLIS